jgi:hypothetical protein
VLTALATDFTFIYLRSRIVYARKIEANNYVTENKLIDTLLNEKPELLTVTDEIKQDKNFEFRLSSRINELSRNEHLYSGTVTPPAAASEVTAQQLMDISLKLIKDENIRKANELTAKTDIFSYLPPIPTIILAGLGVFLSRLIINLADVCCKKSTAR